MIVVVVVVIIIIIILFFIFAHVACITKIITLVLLTGQVHIQSTINSFKTIQYHYLKKNIGILAST